MLLPAPWAAAVVTLAACLAATGPALAQANNERGAGPPRTETEAQSETGSAAPPEPAEETIPYTVEIQGVPEDDLNQLLRQSAQLVALQDRPPSTLAGLRRRADEDLGRLRKALHSEGFYAATLSYSIRRDGAETAVVIQVDTGPVYLLEQARIDYTRAIQSDAIPRDAADLDLEIGMRGRAPRIVAAQRKLLTALENNGFPLAEVTSRKAVVNHDRTTLSVRWIVDPGPEVVFGRWELEGLETVEEGYIRGFRTWQRNAVYDASKVEATRAALMETGLFAGVKVERGEPENGRLPLTFRFQQRAQRSVGFSARFSTDIGPSGEAFWEHRNILGEDEDLRLSAEAGLINQSIGGDFSKPRFLREDQSLEASLELRRHESDAFDEEALSSFLGLERDLGDPWTGSLGGSLEFTRTDDNEGQRTFTLLGAPAGLTRDTRNSVLDPTSGSRLDVNLTPYFVTLDETQAFIRALVAGRTYFAFDSEDRFVLATRASVGSILGVETEQIPASKRFFAGGGGSIRGFPFEKVGPLDAQDDPLGGRSLVELSAELRIKITDTIGVVPFVDAGNVYDSPLPDPWDNDRELRVGAGIGVRYYTAIGPVRLDVAVPVNRRDDVDGAFEVYISLGQAF